MYFDSKDDLAFFLIGYIPNSEDARNIADEVQTYAAKKIQFCSFSGYDQDENYFMLNFDNDACGGSVNGFLVDDVKGSMSNLAAQFPDLTFYLYVQNVETKDETTDIYQKGNIRSSSSIRIDSYISIEPEVSQEYTLKCKMTPAELYRLHGALDAMSIQHEVV